MSLIWSGEWLRVVGYEGGVPCVTGHCCRKEGEKGVITSCIFSFLDLPSCLSKGSCLGRFAPGRLSQILAFSAVHGYSHNVSSVRAAT